MRNLTWTKQNDATGRIEYVATDSEFVFTIARAYGWAEREWDMGVHRNNEQGECVTVMQGFATLREAKAEAEEFSW